MGRRRTRRETRDTTKAIQRLFSRLARITDQCRDADVLDELYQVGIRLEQLADLTTAPPQEQPLSITSTFPQEGDRVRVEGQTDPALDGTYRIGGAVAPEPEGVGHA